MYMFPAQVGKSARGRSREVAVGRGLYKKSGISDVARDLFRTMEAYPRKWKVKVVSRYFAHLWQRKIPGGSRLLFPASLICTVAHGLRLEFKIILWENI